jgi:hypothetical protein
MTRTGVVRLSIAALVGMLALAGCSGGPGPHPTSHVTKAAAPPTTHPSGSASPMPTPGATAAPLPADALFRVTATATAPSGAVADLTLTVFAPKPLSSAESAKLTSDCPNQGWPGNYPNPTAIRATATATLHPGSPAWTSYSPVGFGPTLGNLSVWTGKFTAPYDCTAPEGMLVPSTATAVAPISPANSPAGVQGGMGWYNGIYGFSQTYDGDDPNGPAASLDVKLSNCALQLGPLALAGNPDTASWVTEPQGDPGFTCGFGPTG